MTRAGRRRNAALLLVAPVAVGTLTLTTSWASVHAPEQPSAQQVARPVGGDSARLRAQLGSAANDLQQSQISVLRLNAALRDRSNRLRLLATRMRQAGAQGKASPVEGSWSGTAGNVAAPAPVPVSVPSAPQVSTTTGAS